MRSLLLNFLETFSSVTVAIAAFVSAAIIIITAVGKLRRAVWRPIDWLFFKRRREYRAKFDQHIELVKTIDSRTQSTESGMARMEAQLQDNGGNSLRDVVIQTRDVCGYLSARTRYHDDSNPVPIFELDAKGELTFANCAFCTLLDTDEKDLKHKDYIARIHGDDRDRFEHEMDRAKQNKMPLETMIKFSVGKTGPVTVRMVISPDVRQDKELRGFFARAEKVES